MVMVMVKDNLIQSTEHTFYHTLSEMSEDEFMHFFCIYYLLLMYQYLLE